MSAEQARLSLSARYPQAQSEAWQSATEPGAHGPCAPGSTMPALLERPKLSNAMARALHRHIMMERERKRQGEPGPRREGTCPWTPLFQAPPSGRSVRRRQKLGGGWNSPVVVGVLVARSDLQNSSAGKDLGEHLVNFPSPAPCSGRQHWDNHFCWLQSPTF